MVISDLDTPATAGVVDSSVTFDLPHLVVVPLTREDDDPVPSVVVKTTLISPNLTVFAEKPLLVDAVVTPVHDHWLLVVVRV